MRRVFADTSFYAAMVNERDALHGAALAFARGYRGEVVTTEYVMVELRHWFARSAFREQFASVANLIRTDPGTVVVPAERSLLTDGVALYASRPDKNWSLTDCVSFVVMRQLGLDEVLTADARFEEAGFRVVIG